MAGFLDMLTPTTIANYARGAWDGVSINSWVYNELKKSGAFIYDVGGDSLSGPIEAGRYIPITSAPGVDLSSQFVPKVRHQRWNFPWAEMVNATVLDRGMLRRNSGDQALVRLRDTELPALFRDLLIAPGFGLLWALLSQNGFTYSGSGLPVYGLPSFLLAPSSTGVQGFSTGTKAATGSVPAATDKEVCATATSQTYGGLSIAPNGLTGIDGVQYDAWMPTIVNTTCTGFTDGTVANNIELALMYLVNRLTRFGTNDPSLMPNLGLLDGNYYRALGAKKSAREQIFVLTSQKDPIVPDTGYAPITGINHAGLVWKWDENMPVYGSGANVGSAYVGNTR
jgi:hypothetical protein